MTHTYTRQKEWVTETRYVTRRCLKHTKYEPAAVHCNRAQHCVGKQQLLREGSHVGMLDAGVVCLLL